MVAAVRDAMLKAGLIAEIEPRLIFGRGSSPIDRIPVKVSRYEMPIPVHMQWCSAVAVESGEGRARDSAVRPHSALSGRDKGRPRRAQGRALRAPGGN